MTPWMLLLAAASWAHTDPAPGPPVNAVLGDTSFVAAFGRAPTASDPDDLRVATHLRHVVALLRATAPPAGATADAAARRAASLDALERYIARGDFPRNRTAAARTPVFIDDAGRRCAVAELIAVSAGEDLARRVDARHRFDPIARMDLPALHAWAAWAGFTRDELAMIQPGYGRPLQFAFRTLAETGPPPDGAWTHRAAVPGKDEARRWVMEGAWRDGRFDGPWLRWDEEGRLRGHGEFVAGTGLWHGYDAAGALVVLGRYRDGRAEGRWVVEGADGAVAELTFEAGVLHGPARALGPGGGPVLAEGHFAPSANPRLGVDEVGVWRYRSPDGRLLAVHDFDGRTTTAYARVAGARDAVDVPAWTVGLWGRLYYDADGRPRRYELADLDPGDHLGTGGMQFETFEFRYLPNVRVDLSKKGGAETTLELPRRGTIPVEDSDAGFATALCADVVRAAGGRLRHVGASLLAARERAELYGRMAASRTPIEEFDPDHREGVAARRHADSDEDARELAVFEARSRRACLVKVPAADTGLAPADPAMHVAFRDALRAELPDTLAPLIPVDAAVPVAAVGMYRGVVAGRRVTGLVAAGCPVGVWGVDGMGHNPEESEGSFTLCGLTDADACLARCATVRAEGAASRRLATWPSTDPWSWAERGQTYERDRFFDVLGWTGTMAWQGVSAIEDLVERAYAHMLDRFPCDGMGRSGLSATSLAGAQHAWRCVPVLNIP